MQTTGNLKLKLKRMDSNMRAKRYNKTVSKLSSIGEILGFLKILRSKF